MAGARAPLLAGVAAMLLIPTAAVAQGASPEESTNGASDPTADASAQGGFKDIVVTAQRRTERLQDVPISAQVVSGEDIQNRGITSVQDLSGTLPGVIVRPGGRTDRLFIRGIGSGGSPALEQSVGLFVDGVYHGRSRSTRASFLDVGRVEVLRGPQSLYFGNNAISGAMSVTTQAPGRDFELEARALYGSDDEYQLEAASSLPITDTLGIRVAGLYGGMGGWMTNLADNSSFPKNENVAGRVTVQWQPLETLTVRAKAERGSDFSGGGLPFQLIGCPPPAPFAGPAGFCATAIAAGQETKLDERTTLTPGQNSDLDSEEYVLSVDYEHQGVTVSSITAYSSYVFEMGLDLDELAANIFSAFTDEDYWQFSQELRVASDPTRPLSFVIGGYYQDYRLTVDTDFSYNFLNGNINAAPPLAPLRPFLPLGQSSAFTERGTVLSAFGALTWRVTDQLRLTAGGRWTGVDKDTVQTVFFGQGALYGDVTPLPATVQPIANNFGRNARLGVAGVINLSRSDEDFTPSVNIQYDITSRIMAYASYSGGFKAGGINGSDNTGIPEALPFGPETVDAYEVGIKASFPNLIVNAALFRSDYHDRQVTISQLLGNTPVNIIRNAAESRVQGAELEVRWLPFERLVLGADISLLDSKYLSYPNAGPTNVQLLQGQRTQDLSGRQTEFAPDVTARFDVTYSYPIGSTLELRANANAFYSSEYSVITSLDPRLFQDDYVRIDARLALASADDRWELSVIGRNLTDERILAFGNDLPTSPGSYSAFIDRTRSFAVQLQVRF
jgi:outer membrane receptor protein involved in Fe transport